MTDQNQEPTTVQDNEESLEGLIDAESLESFKKDTTEETQEQQTNAQESTEEESQVETEKESTDAEEVESKPEETETAKNNEGTDNKPFLTIKYNKQDKELSQEDAITLAQKGMNYDHLQSKVDSLSKTTARLEEQAKANGMTVDEYLDKLDEVQRDFEYNNALEKAKAENPGADEKLLERIVKAEIELSRKDKELNKVNTKTKIAEEKHADLQKQIDKFLSIHTDIKADQLESVLTDDMYELMDQGYTISEAYDKIKSNEAVASNSAAKAQAKVNQKKEDNKSKSLGNISNSGETTKDPLEEAMLSAFKE